MERSIAVINDVKDLSELLGGASVDQARLMAAGGRLRLELELTRAMTERPPVAHQGLWKRAATPWIKCRLTLEDILDVAVSRVDETPESGPLLECDAISGGYQLVVRSPDGLQLSLTLDRLRGAFEDVGAPIHSP